MAAKLKKIQKELEAIRKSHGGHLRPEDIVEFARDKKTALHSRFQWDDTDAAHQWRLQQARQIIRVHVTVIQEDVGPVRAYVSLKTDRHHKGGYRAMVDVLSDEEQYAQMLADALDELRTFRAKYNKLKELRPVWDAIDSIEPKATKKAS
jgi:hypothetical protein